MVVALILIFVAAYPVIALEHPLKISKSATALFAAGLLWTVYALSIGDRGRLGHELDETVTATARITFFLLGAMTIVEVIDAHDGFALITSRIRKRGMTGLLWLVSWVTFFLSAVLDNLTTTIVMVSLMRKLLDRSDNRLLFASVIVVAANAGGAWSPMGDVTTTMLWIGGQVTALGIIKALLLASVVNLLVPLVVVIFGLRGIPFQATSTNEASDVQPFERNLMLVLGLGVLIAVPAFKQVTHLPPFMGILFGLGILWLAGEILHRDKPLEQRHRLTLAHALSRIDLSSLLFFVGILFAVATLEHAKILEALAGTLNRAIGRQDVIVLLLGILSAIVDNVPLVAAAMGMYPLSQYPTDSLLWEFMAYCAGTGGSILIIGSAAGVAAMGIEKIQFIWYMRRIAGLAALGYFAGAVVYIVQFRLTH
ncbi:sodium:proton antiporter NhaD [Bradyrhizobium jicamae]|uniref:Sodium:proton antiporter NhaD n=1 Tax=Bradyrhizobium jicamae TaxID=280332 RepID=A0ABS5FWS4_9BRAD|nr:sodium:proton antiporter NhaD [Bradyrhizobium jicamae]MBR0801275.1 sodium:proton antiporter NhaD [Bradyrhizobium jicamae]MBR0935740.1 sodium:proton antiporter NhaD [Bradyrhizobium jicamae]